MKDIKVKYHVPAEEIPAFRISKIDKGDWIDLRSPEALSLKAGKVYTISLGISMQLPDGYEAWVLPRSSMLLKKGLVCIMGVIDNSYCGDNDIWALQVYASRDCEIDKFERIAQFRIHKKMPTINFVECETLGNPDRGGFGVTGTH